MFSFFTSTKEPPRTATSTARSSRRRGRALSLETLEVRIMLQAYTPAEVRAAYGVGHINGDGADQTIAIVDPYNGDPDIAADLKNFDNFFGIQDPPSFSVVNQGGPAAPLGAPTTPDPTYGKGIEESMDVEWTHAMAPGAKIVLVEANSPNPNDYLAAAAEAATLGSVVSMSFGWTEASNPFINEMSVDAQYFQVPGVTFLASTGDNGSPGEYPAYSPDVVAVGGTTLQLNDDSDNSAIQSETGWGNFSGGILTDGSGGGTSQHEPRPLYQNNPGVTNRAIPDVSMIADYDNSPVWVYDSYDFATVSPPFWGEEGGTSLSCPCWAGLIAIADQLLVANGGTSLTGYDQTLPDLYNLPLSDFHDITTGSNGAYTAGPGYDEVTGLGTPVANLLVPDLVGTNAELVYTAPSSTAVSFTSPVTPTPKHNIVVTQVGANIEVDDNGTLVTSHPASDTSEIDIYGGDASGTISLTVDYSGGQFAIPVNFDGGTGGGAHTLMIESGNGTFTSETETPSSSTGGTIQFENNPLITYSNVTSVDDTATVTGTATCDGTTGGEHINIVPGALVSGTQTTQINSGASGTFAPVNIANKTNVAVDGLEGVDTICVGSETGAGGDIHFLTSPLSVNGGGQAGDSFIVDDSGDPTGGQYTITGASVIRTGSQTIAYSGFSQLTVNGSLGNDVFKTGGAITALTLAGGPGDDQYVFGPSTILNPILNSKYTIIELPGEGNDTVDFSGLPAADPPAQAADWIDGMQGATPTSLCSEPDVGTVNVGAAGQQQNIEYGLNIDPYLDLSGVPSEAVFGEPFIFRYVDVGTKMTHHSSVAWGDGTITDPLALVPAYSGLEGIATLGHPFAPMTTHTVTFTVTNKNLSVPTPGTSAMAKATIKIVSAMVAPDPQAPGQTALFVGTSQAVNNITLIQELNGSIIVILSGPPYDGVFMPSAGGHLYVYATTGSSTVTLGPTVTHDAVVYTGPGRDIILDYGSGNDRLHGGGISNVIRAGSGNDIVYGGYGTNQLYAGTGNDVLVGGGLLSFLYGGLGRDVLIGGPGQSFLYGGAGDDLMIAGTTGYDSNDAALTAILNEWTSGNSFAIRIGHLQGTLAGGANGAFLLSAATVHANGMRNYLYGGLKQNWFFANPGPGLPSDIVVKKPTDMVTTI